MKISNKLQKLVDQGLISVEQAEKIMLSEQTKNSNLAWKLMYWIAGLLIGLGVVLIIGANWDSMSAPVKLFGDFVILAGIIYGAYWSIINKQDKLKELFLTLAFLFVGATIGLIGQVFNLSGGWQSFAIAWAILSFVFIAFSRLVIVNIIWLCLFFSSVDFWYLFEWFVIFMRGELSVIIASTLCFSLLTYAGNQIYKSINKVIVLPKALATFCFINMYLIALIGGIILGFNNTLAIIFVLVFLGIRLFLAMQNKNIKSFVQNTHLMELYILFLFITRYGNLFMSGVGFILGGILILGILYMLKKTSKYIKTMEVFHE